MVARTMSRSGSASPLQPDLDAFYKDWGVPGVSVSYSEILPDEMTLAEVLDVFALADSCTDAGGSEEQVDGDLRVISHEWTKCGGTDTGAFIFAGTPAESPDYYVVVEVYTASPADQEALSKILGSFLVTAPAPADTSQTTTTTDSGLFDLVDTSKLTYDYVAVTDPAVVALIPKEYSDTSSSTWETSDGELLGFTFRAAPDIAKFNDSWAEPGLIVKSALDMTEALDPDEMLADDNLTENCTYDDRYTDEHTIDGVTYQVAYDVYTKCGGTDSGYVYGIAQTDPPAQVLFFDFGVASDADAEALDVLLKTFGVDTQLAADALAAAQEDQGTQLIPARSSFPSPMTPQPSPSTCPRRGRMCRASPGIWAMAQSAMPWWRRPMWRTSKQPGTCPVSS